MWMIKRLDRGSLGRRQSVDRSGRARPVESGAEGVRDQLRADAQAVAALDMDPASFRRHGHELVDWIAEYLEHSGEISGPLAQSARETSSRRFPPRRRRIPNPSAPSWPTSSACSSPASPTGTIPAFSPTSRSPPARPACWPSFSSAALNQQAMLWRTSPAATELEAVALAWLRKLLGLPDVVRRGHLRHRVDLDAARARRRSRGGRARGAQRAGWPDASTVRRWRSTAPSRRIPRSTRRSWRSDWGSSRCAGFRPTLNSGCDPSALARAIADDRAAGVLPIAVVATVGTTSTTSIDPVPAIADICAP